MNEVILSVPDISCEHCARTVTEALTPVDGVDRVRVDVAGKQVTVAYDPQRASLDGLKSALAAEDYPVAASRPA